MRILYASSLSPFPADNGGRQRTKLIWEALAALGEVDLAVHSAWPLAPEVVNELRDRYSMIEYHVSLEPRGSIFAALMWTHPGLAYRWSQRYARRRTFYAERPAVAPAMRARCESGRYDILVSRYFRCAARSGLLAYAPLCIDVDDVDWEFFASAVASGELGWFRRLVYRHQARVLRELMSRRLAPVETAWISKPEDGARIGPVRTQLLRNAVDATVPPAARPVTSASRAILFVGSLGWPPNQRGLIRFVREVLPVVAQRCPGIRLRVVGSDAPAVFAEMLRQQPHVEFIGTVPDVAPWYADCLFSIVPVDSGAGSHIKIPESLYHGVTCVTSGFGHRGYEEVFPANQSLLIARDNAGWIDACTSLITDPERRMRLAAHGLAIVKRQFCKPAFYRTVADSIAEVLARTSGGVRKRTAASPG